MMLALLYFSFIFAGSSQSSFSTSRYHASNGSSACGNRSQKTRNVLFATILMTKHKMFPKNYQVMCSHYRTILFAFRSSEKNNCIFMAMGRSYDRRDAPPSIRLQPASVIKASKGEAQAQD